MDLKQMLEEITTNLSVGRCFNTDTFEYVEVERDGEFKLELLDTTSKEKSIILISKTYRFYNITEEDTIEDRRNQARVNFIKEILRCAIYGDVIIKSAKTYPINL